MSQLGRHSLRGSRGARFAAALALAALVSSALVWMGRASADDGGPAAEPLAAVHNVAVGRADAVDATADVCTSSGAFVDMPNMSSTFTFGGTASRPVLVLFQGRWANATFGDAVIELTIDGVVQPGPGTGVRLHRDDASPDIESNGFNFVSASLAPGTHTAKIRWATADNTICVGARSLIVLHR